MIEKMQFVLFYYNINVSVVLKTFLPVRSKFSQILKASFDINDTIKYIDVLGLIINLIYHINIFWDDHMFVK